jgi:hypothetical protein
LLIPPLPNLDSVPGQPSPPPYHSTPPPLPPHPSPSSPPPGISRWEFGAPVGGPEHKSHGRPDPGGCALRDPHSGAFRGCVLVSDCRFDLEKAVKELEHECEHEFGKQVDQEGMLPWSNRLKNFKKCMRMLPWLLKGDVKFAQIRDKVNLRFLMEKSLEMGGDCSTREEWSAVWEFVSRSVGRFEITKEMAAKIKIVESSSVFTTIPNLRWNKKVSKATWDKKQRPAEWVSRDDVKNLYDRFFCKEQPHVPQVLMGPHEGMLMLPCARHRWLILCPFITPPPPPLSSPFSKLHR